MRKTTIERANFRLIESELYSYHDQVRELSALQDDVIYGAPIQNEIRTPGISKTTEQKAMQIVSSVVISELSRRVTAIEFAVHMLRNAAEDRKLRLLELKYFERRLTDIGIMSELCIEQATFYRWRREIIELVAQKLGWKT